MMEIKYSIEEIINAIDNLNKKDKKNLIQKESDKTSGTNEIPTNTLRIIEEAEKKI